MLPCPYNAVCWVNIKEPKWLIPVCYVPVACGRKEIVLTARIHHLFLTQVLLKPTLHDTKDPMKLSLTHTMLFVGSIWNNKCV
jgi:hypothetical protein